MKLLIENWRKFLSEKRWEDYDVPKDEWFKVPLEDIRQAAMERGGEINIADELHHLINTAYKSIGGHLKLQNIGDMPEDYTDWIAVDLDGDPEPDALRFSKGPKRCRAPVMMVPAPPSMPIWQRQAVDSYQKKVFMEKCLRPLLTL